MKINYIIKCFVFLCKLLSGILITELTEERFDLSYTFRKAKLLLFKQAVLYDSRNHMQYEEYY